jgi:hypothetical protein
MHDDSDVDVASEPDSSDSSNTSDESEEDEDMPIRRTVPLSPCATMPSWLLFCVPLPLSIILPILSFAGGQEEHEEYEGDGEGSRAEPSFGGF